MKKRFTSLLTIRVGVLILCFAAFADMKGQDATVDGIGYTIVSTDNHTVEVSAYQNPGSYGADVTIPRTISYNAITWTVVAIGDNAFSVYSPESLLRIELPYTITRIGNNAFSGCRNLTTVSGGSGVKEIGEYAFFGCSSLASPYFSPEMTSIGNYAFRDCTSLTFASIGEDIESLGIGVYRGCTGIGTLYIHKTIDIPEELCYGCTSLSTVQFEESYMRALSVGAYAFYGCSELTTIRLSDNFSAGDGAFWNCAKLNLGIITTHSSIGHHAFSNCENLTCIVDLSGDIGDSAFYGSGISEAYVLSNNIGSGAFSYCRNLTTVTLLNVSTIPSSIFSGCSALKSITLPNNYTSIGANAFRGCELITAFRVPNTVTSIGNYAFSGCSALASLRFMGVRPQFGDMTSTIMYDCPLLTDIYFPACDYTSYNIAVMKTGYVSVGPSVERTLHPQIILPKEWNSYCATASFDVPEGIDAYIVRKYNNSTVTLQQVMTINQGEGLLLKVELTNTPYNVNLTDDIDIYPNNLLEGTTAPTDLSTPAEGYTNFVLSNGEFRKATGTIQAYKAYLPLPTNIAASNSLSFVIDTETAGIHETHEKGVDMSYYDLYGQHYEDRPTKKGIFIVNGKKIVNK